ncbi:DGQHR domain-containing protein [Bradyrhizobium sp. 187]|uniref:DGQHR domain-containing protein n=1 Tax=Bradyrhizobium sp. 187 TaxID=2782655 RepID=UPI0020000B97|nr:DGQHR domain-containing protein [Bradyrhizobium sp. 187]UPJ76927.1 DGQHR domain-containing protein [Bradyrhizobium sp. 187]
MVATLAESVIISCLRGNSAHRPVLLGFARADLLFRLSFADILEEATGRGYQRPFNERHSQDFRRYIKEPASSTIPLTLNLRPCAAGEWKLIESDGASVTLEISPTAGKIMAQVDCQHRLGHLGDLPILLPFMCFIGLSEREEMEVFNVINSKARGLSTSLLDFHEAQLAQELAIERPELFIALRLNSTDGSPWQGRLNLGGSATAGLKRIVSLRMMQQAINDFLKATRSNPASSPDEAAQVVLDFWQAVAAVLPNEWKDTRHHMLTKGVGVYALMHIAADIFNECRQAGRPCDRRAFIGALSDFANTIDWSTTGRLKGFGGQAGVKAAVELVREARRLSRYKVVNG